MRVVQKTGIGIVPTARAPQPATRPVHLELLVTQLMQRLRLAVIYGGDKSAERAVIHPAGNPRSWKSYQSVARDIGDALERHGAPFVELLPDDMRLGERLRDERIHLAWLNTGGVQGHSSVAHAAAMLEMYGIPYVGHDPLNAALLDNKYVFKRQLMAIGIPTAPFVVWHPSRSPADPTSDPRFLAVFAHWDGGFIVKPVSGRASLHVHYVEHADQIARTVETVFGATLNSVLIEAYLPGREYCIAVSGPTVIRGGRLEQLPGPFAFSGVERMLEPDERVFTSMDLKPITTQRVRPLDPRGDAYVLEGLEELAQTLYTEFPLKTLVRLDVRADRHGRLYVLEANPKPDLKAAEGSGTSLIAAGLSRYGMSYDELIASIFADRIAQMRADADGTLDRLLGQVGA